MHWFIALPWKLTQWLACFESTDWKFQKFLWSRYSKVTKAEYQRANSLCFFNRKNIISDVTREKFKLLASRRNSFLCSMLLYHEINFFLIEWCENSVSVHASCSAINIPILNKNLQRASLDRRICEEINILRCIFIANWHIVISPQVYNGQWLYEGNWHICHI